MKLITTQEYFDKNPTREERTTHIDLNEPCDTWVCLEKNL